MKFDKICKKILEMTSAGVTGTSGYESGGIAPQDKVPYAKGDARVPKVLGMGTKSNKKKKKKATAFMRRPKIGM